MVKHTIYSTSQLNSVNKLLEILFIVLGEQVSVGGIVNSPRNASFYCDITFTRYLCQTIFFRRE
jgi:hypothetical protein